MPRAVMICEKYGLTPIPAPTDFYVNVDNGNNPFNFKPSKDKMIMFEKALHEYLGIILEKVTT